MLTPWGSDQIDLIVDVEIDIVIIIDRDDVVAISVITATTTAINIIVHYPAGLAVNTLALHTSVGRVRSPGVGT